MRMAGQHVRGLFRVRGGEVGRWQWGVDDGQLNSDQGMVLVPGGSFVMGSMDFYPEERSLRRTEAPDLWLDEHPVTNAEFRRFVADTGHRTIAERGARSGGLSRRGPGGPGAGIPAVRGYPGPVPLDDWMRWWAWAPGASWKHPEGPGSTLHRRELHPHGFTRTSPVKRFPPNGFGLFDVAGNVWEWTSTPWTPTHDDVAATPAPSCCGPERLLSEQDRRATKGGSHLCAPSYCHPYRPAARQAHAVRSTTSHLGFRCCRPA